MPTTNHSTAQADCLWGDAGVDSSSIHANGFILELFTETAKPVVRVASSHRGLRVAKVCDGIERQTESELSGEANSVTELSVVPFILYTIPLVSFNKQASIPQPIGSGQLTDPCKGCSWPYRTHPRHQAQTADSTLERT